MAKTERVTVENSPQGHGVLLDGEPLIGWYAERFAVELAATLNAAFDKTATDARADEREQCLGELGVAQASGCSVLIAPGVVYAMKVLRRGAE